MQTVSLCLFTVFTGALQIATTVANIKCRSKYGHFEPQVFKLHACAYCYDFLTEPNNVAVLPVLQSLIFGANQSTVPKWTILVADAENSTLSEIVCKTINADKCIQWKRCCFEATQCCERQLKSPPRTNGTCPQTWDGYGCWDDTPPGSTVYMSCPAFLQHSSSSWYAEKHCRQDGRWFAKGNNTKDHSGEWTDYTKCMDMQGVLVSLYLGLACNIASIALLAPAIGIFVLYRSLRKQHRIRLHINLFLALVFSNIITIVWDILIGLGRLTGSSSSLIIHTAGACKFLAFLRLYSRSTTYVWMFCEGFYLHRLISNAFRPPKSLLLLYLIGWGFPLCYTSLYGILRLIYVIETYWCWIRSTGHFQWILYVPNFGCLLVNLLFLCNILRILLTQLQSHPNEPSNFRRALKATFVLIPLFGVQLFVTIYRLPAGSPVAPHYERLSVFISNSQGFFVALIFCFFNGEVISHVKKTCTRMKLLRNFPNEMSRGQTTATSVNFAHQGPDSHESENGNLVYESPKQSPGTGKKAYCSMELNERKYPYIPLVTRVPAPSPTEVT